MAIGDGFERRLEVGMRVDPVHFRRFDQTSDAGPGRRTPRHGRRTAHSCDSAPAGGSCFPPRYPGTRIIPESMSREPIAPAMSGAKCLNNHKLFRNAKRRSSGSYLLIGVSVGVVLAMARSFSFRSACR